jgi:urease accessory protein
VALALSSLLERTTGELRLTFAARDGVTHARETFQSGALRVRFPRASHAAQATLINTAGGLTGGDSCELAIAVERAATVVVATQACERIYRSAAGEARIATTIEVHEHGVLDYLPQPTIVYDGGRVQRETIVELAGSAQLLAIEAAVLGRTAMGETFQRGSLRDNWRVRRNGALIFADSVRLDGAVDPAAWAFAGARAYATFVYSAPDAAERADALRALLAGSGGVSYRDGFFVARILTADGYMLTQTLTRVLDGFRGCPLPRSWSL